MPRVTPCRVVKLFFLVWAFMIFLWWTLPSPTIPAHEREAYIQKTLASGRPLITVMDWTKAFNDPRDGNMSRDQAYIIRWQLDQAPRDQGVLLKLGPVEVANLTDTLAKANLLNAEQSGTNGSAWLPFFEDARKFGGVWASDVEFSEICLPWFHSADKHFITHEMHGYQGWMTLRFVVPEPGVLELWLETIVTNHLNPNDYNSLMREVPPGNLQKARQELLRTQAYENLLEEERHYGLLATFKSAEMKQVRDVVVVGMQGDLLSKTYPIRRALLAPLAPVWSIGYFLLDIMLSIAITMVPGLLFILSQLGLAGAGIMLSCWLRDGRPEFSEWTRHFWMTRWIPRRAGDDAKKVWGPSGPVSKEDAKLRDWDEEAAMLQRPPTVRLGRSWKR